MKLLSGFYLLAFRSAFVTPLAKAQQLWGTTSKGGANSNGTIFKIEYCKGNFTHTVVYSFPSATDNGSSPFGSLVRHSSGMLYGTTNVGGVNNLGVIFQIDPITGDYTKRFDFDGQKGANPVASLVEAPNGKLYGLTPSGGSNNVGVFYEFDPATGIVLVKKQLDNTSGNSPYDTPILAPNGKLYGTLSGGGSDNFGAIFEFDPNTSAWTKKYDFKLNGPSGQFPWTGGGPKADLALASDGYMYGITGGATYGTGAAAIFRYDYVNNAAVPKYNFAWDGNNGPDGQYFLGGLMQASNGKLYGMASNGGNSGWGTLFEFDPVNSVLVKPFDFFPTDRKSTRLNSSH